MKKATELFQCLITSDGLISQEKNIEKPLREQRRHFDSKKLIELIDQFSPATGREKTLAIHHCFGRSMINIPSTSSAERLIRNKEIFRLYKAGKSYEELAQYFGITERWIRVIINIMLKRSISR